MGNDKIDRLKKIFLRHDLGKQDIKKAARIPQIFAGMQQNNAGV